VVLHKKKLRNTVSESRKRSYLLSGYGNRGRCPQVGWRRAQGEKHLASGLESAPLAPASRPAADLHLRPRHRTEPAKAQQESKSVFCSQQLSILAQTTEHPLTPRLILAQSAGITNTAVTRRQIVFSGETLLFFLHKCMLNINTALSVSIRNHC
jgi:hypothetical protein